MAQFRFSAPEGQAKRKQTRREKFLTPPLWKLIGLPNIEFFQYQPDTMMTLLDWLASSLEVGLSPIRLQRF